MSGKIFGIGFTKTGITSLTRALEILGYHTYQNLVINTRRGLKIDRPIDAQKILPPALKITSRYDAVSDDPWPMLFREMDRAFPGSKFILTIRKPDRWIASMVRHFADEPADYRQWIYGRPWPKGNENHYCDIYEKHNTAVRAYFSSRPGDLLELDAEQGDGWEKLALFLDKAPPQGPYPRENTAEQREKDLRQPKQRFYRAIRKILGP